MPRRPGESDLDHLASCIEFAFAGALDCETERWALIDRIKSNQLTRADQAALAVIPVSFSAMNLLDVLTRFNELLCTE